MVTPDTLENPERDIVLEGRPVAAVEPATVDIAHRLVAARRLAPGDGDGCRACWTKGRDAAVRQVAASVGDGADLADALTRAGAIAPEGSELHWVASWIRGRDAALEIIEGE